MRNTLYHRRKFMALMAGLTVTLPASVASQQATKIPRVGILWHAGNEAEEAVYLGALRQGLADLGYVEGRNITLINTFADEKYDRFNSNAVELVSKKVDVLVAVTTPAALAAQRATQTIPIAFMYVPDPVRSKLVESLARPGRNITGLSTMQVEITAKRLEVFKDCIAGLKRVALLMNPHDSDNAARYLEETRTAAKLLDVVVTPAEVREPADLERVFATLTRERVDGIVQVADALLYNMRAQVAELARSRGLPFIGQNEQVADAGALMSYGIDAVAIARRLPVHIDKILKGAKPGDLPVEQPTKFDFVINLKTAKALGIEIAPSQLARATKLIE